MSDLLDAVLAEFRVFLRPLLSVVEAGDPFALPPEMAARTADTPDAVRTDAEVRLDRFVLLLTEAGIDPTAQFGSVVALRDQARSILTRIMAIATSGAVPSLDDLRSLYLDLRALVTTPPARPDLADAPEAALRKLLDRMVTVYLETRHQGLLAAGQVLGIARPAIPGLGRRAEVDLDRIDRLLSDPATLFAEIWGWGAGELGEIDLLMEIADALDRLGVPHALEVGTPTADHPDDAQIAYLAVPLVDVWNPAGDAGVDLRVFVPGTGGLAVTLAAGTDWRLDRDMSPWHLKTEGTFDVDRMPIVTLAPPATPKLAMTGAGQPPADAAFRAELRRDGTVALLSLGDLGAVTAEAIVLAAWFDTDDGLAAGLSAGLEDGAVTIGTDEADGFLARMLPPGGLTAPFALSGGFDSHGGFHLDGSVGLAFDKPLTAEIGGVLRLDMLHVDARLGTAGAQAEVAISGGATLGPFSTAIERVGLRSALARLSAAASDASDGAAYARRVAARAAAGDTDPALQDLGDLAAATGFRPPTGIGLAFSLGPIGGGGFVAFDEPQRRYAGALALQAEAVGLSAFGVVVTRMPDGSDGFSLLAFVRGEFAPIPLGFGFTLNAVGGLFGINRDVDTEALFTAVRAGTAGDLLAPEDPIGDAPRLLEQAERIFPVRRGQHVFGPTLQLGWGAPAEIITLDLALALTLPEPLRILLVGRLRAALPLPEAPVVSLNMDVGGVLDLSAGTLEAEGRLFDSGVVGIAITGGFALRTAWGRTRAFAFSVGGLHPGFTPPAGFPVLPRAGVSLADSAAFSLQLAGYFAVTSNTLQLGAGIDLMARVSRFGLAFQAGFDALIVFEPFSLDAELRASARIFAGSRTLMKLSVRARLTGPNPWRVRGKATFEIFWVDVEIGFDKRFGRPEEIPTGRATPEIILADEVADPRNWTGEPSARFVVAQDVTSLDPTRPLAFAQKAVPLEMRMAHFGGRAIDGPRRFDPTGLRFGGGGKALGPAPKAAFAPAQFLDYDEADRLAAPAFEDRTAGVATRPDDVRTLAHVPDDARRRVLRIDARPGGPPVTADQTGWDAPDWFVAERQAAKVGLIALYAETWAPGGADAPTGDAGTYGEARAASDDGRVHRSSEAA